MPVKKPRNPKDATDSVEARRRHALADRLDARFDKLEARVTALEDDARTRADHAADARDENV